jgi:LPS sulfotransferase NodH
MNNRWCIICVPRSGSNYLEEMLYQSIMSQQSSLVMRLGEILHRIIWNYTDSEDAGFKLTADYNSIVRKKFREDLMENLESDPTTGAVIRLFSQSHHLLDMDYNGFLNKLQSLNFKFIHLTRNPVDSAISLCMAQATNLWHRSIQENTKVEVIDGNAEYAKNPTKINIPLTVIGANFIDIKLTDYYNKENLKTFEYIKIRYESMLEDCNANKVPIVEKTGIKKLHDQSYSELIENYDEIQQFCEELTNNG